MNEIKSHYDLLITDGNDPVLDPPELKQYMDKWDGDLFFELLELNKIDKVLEIGCGTGRLSLKVAPNVKSFCGVDVSEKTIEKAKEHLRFDNISLICTDFLEYGFDEKFDLVFSSLTFMHIKEKLEAIAKISSLLNPNGRVVISLDKNRETYIEYGTRKLEIYPDTPNEIMALMGKVGLTNIETHETEFAYIVKANK